ncbi:class II fructose-bisphosphate aldolase [Luoshenia tenuis]|jgi:ketose-bisphosphate aldolase|uniref:class II fructose-bisphosphate aldolase n=1 Tax=Luoshenia tenuis TaxID=2763654 RepID=UPI003D8FAE5C
MQLVNPILMLQKATEQKKAICALNAHTCESIQAIVWAAQRLGAPVMVAASQSTLQYMGVAEFAAIAKAVAKKADVPVALHLDHCTKFPMIVECIKEGFTSVMIDGSHLPYEENLALAQKVVEVAHAAGVAVESELGRVGGAEDDLNVDEREATFTVPEEAADYVRRSGVDSLAVAIGTAHGVYKGTPKLDLERLSAIRAAVSVPLVLHGASGVPDEAVRAAIARGIAKVNIATELKIPMAGAVREVLLGDENETDPRRYMGHAREVVSAVAEKKILLCGADQITF